MTQPIRVPSDAAIERGIASRAPRGADAALLDSVMTAVHATDQVSSRGARLGGPIGGRSRPFVWMALAAVLLIAGALVFSTGSFAPAIVTPTPSAPAPTQPAAVVSPSPSLAASPIGSAETCATETTRVLTGDAMPPTSSQPMTIEAGVLEVGVYLTSAAVEDHGGQTDVWAITSGTAERIASIVGPDFNQSSVDDVSVDGQTALIGVGVIHGGLPGPSCSDLYAVRTDGSGAKRLTFKGPDQYASDGTFSHDGRYVAFVSREEQASPAIGLVDLHGDAGERDIPCDASTTDLHLAWARIDRRLAAVCGANMMVVDIGGSPPAVVGSTDMYAIPTGGSTPVGIGWRDPGRIVVVTLAMEGTHSNGPFSLATLTFAGGAAPREGTWSPTVTAKPWLGDGGASTDIAVAPDGHALTLLGDPAEDDPQGNTLALYAMDASSGVHEPVPGAGNDVAWSPDSRSLVYTEFSGETPVLTVYDLAGRAGLRYGSLPIDYHGGVWRVS